jgi:hypothetical protein
VTGVAGDHGSRRRWVVSERHAGGRAAVASEGAGPAGAPGYRAVTGTGGGRRRPDRAEEVLDGD